jgi:hypothetical protein
VSTAASLMFLPATFLYDANYSPPRAEDNASDDTSSDASSETSYFGRDIDMWDNRQRECTALLTTSRMDPSASVTPPLRQITSIVEVWPEHERAVAKAQQILP